MGQRIRKAVFPVAGLGTRFLPVTKASPKEMLPIVDKPLIQYAVEEAIEAGIRELIFVTSAGKRAIEDHFDNNFELEYRLREQGKEELLRMVQNIVPPGVGCVYVRQSEPLGLGHAILCAKDVVGQEPFAVLLADDLIQGQGQSCLKQLCNYYQEQPHNLIAVQLIKPEETHQYGVVDVPEAFSGQGAIGAIIEKPACAQAPSLWGVIGRYILNPSIMACLEQTARGVGGELQLTDGIARVLKTESVHAVACQGTRYDCGSKLGYLMATVALGLQHSEWGEAFKQFLKHHVTD